MLRVRSSAASTAFKEAQCGVKRRYGDDAGQAFKRARAGMSWKDLSGFFFVLKDGIVKKGERESVLTSICNLGSANVTNIELSTVLAGLMKAGFFLNKESAVVLQDAAQHRGLSMRQDHAVASFVSFVRLGLEVPDSLLARVTQVALEGTMNPHQAALVAKALPSWVPEETVKAVARGFVEQCKSGALTEAYDFLALGALFDLRAELDLESVRILEETAKKVNFSKVARTLENARWILVILGVLCDQCASKSLLEAAVVILRSEDVSKCTVTAKLAFLDFVVGSYGTLAASHSVLAREAAQQAVCVAAAELTRMSHDERCALLKASLEMGVAGILVESVSKGTVTANLAFLEAAADIKRMSDVERFAVLRACLSLGVALPDGLLGAIYGDISVGASAGVSRAIGSMSREEVTRVLGAFGEAGEAAQAEGTSRTGGAARVLLQLVEDMLISWACEMTQDDLVHALRLYSSCERRVPGKLAERMCILDPKELLVAVLKHPDLNNHDIVLAAINDERFESADQRDVKHAIHALAKLGEVEPGNEEAVARLVAQYYRVSGLMSLSTRVNAALSLVWIGIEIDGLHLSEREVCMLDGANVAKLLMISAITGRAPDPRAIGRVRALIQSSQMESRHIARVAVALAVCSANGAAVDFVGLMGCIRESDSASIGSVELALLQLAVKACPSLGPLSGVIERSCVRTQEAMGSKVKEGIKSLGIDFDRDHDTGLIGVAGNIVVLHENRASVALYSALLSVIGLKHVALSAKEYGLHGPSYLRRMLSPLCTIQSDQAE